VISMDDDMKLEIRRAYAADWMSEVPVTTPLAKRLGLAFTPSQPPGRPLATPHEVLCTPEGRTTHFNGTPLDPKEEP